MGPPPAVRGAHPGPPMTDWGKSLIDPIEENGGAVLLAVGIVVSPETHAVQLRVVMHPELPILLHDTPLLWESLQAQLRNIYELGKPPDDRALSPGTKVFFLQ